MLGKNRIGGPIVGGLNVRQKMSELTRPRPSMLRKKRRAARLTQRKLTYKRPLEIIRKVREGRSVKSIRIFQS
jgi:hypothetical protein